MFYAFTRARPNRAKNTVNLSVFFEISGSVCAIAVSFKMLMKLTPYNFHFSTLS